VRAQDKEEIKKAYDKLEKVGMYNKSDQIIHERILRDVETYCNQTVIKLNSSRYSPSKLTQKTEYEILEQLKNNTNSESGFRKFLEDVANDKYTPEIDEYIFENPEIENGKTVKEHIKEFDNDYGFDFQEFMENELQANPTNQNLYKEKVSEKEYNNFVKLIAGDQMDKQFEGGLDVVIPYQNGSEKLNLEIVINSVIKSWINLKKYMPTLLEILKIPLNIIIVDNSSDDKFLPDEAIKNIKSSQNVKNTNISIRKISIDKSKNYEYDVDFVRRKGTESATHQNILYLDSDIIINPETIPRFYKIAARNLTVNNSLSIISSTVDKYPISEIEINPDIYSIDDSQIAWQKNSSNYKKPPTWEVFLKDPGRFTTSEEIKNEKSIEILKETEYLRKLKGFYRSELTMSAGKFKKPGISFSPTAIEREIIRKTFPIGGYGGENHIITNIAIIQHPDLKIFIDPHPEFEVYHINDFDNKTSENKSPKKHEGLKKNMKFIVEDFLNQRI